MAGARTGGSGLPVVVIETRRMKAYARASSVKTDRRDARLIAQALRAGLYQPVHVKHEAAHAARLMLSARAVLLGQARQLQVKIRGDLKPFGIRLGKIGSGGFAGRVRQRLAERADLMALVAPLLAMRTALLDQVRHYDRRIKAEAMADPVCQRLMGVPGVGPITAFAYKATIDRPERFARSADVPAVLGLVPRIDQSGERERIGAITKAGDTMMRSLLFEAANVLVTRTRKSFALKRWGLRLAERRGMNRARVAVARRLAIVLHRIWAMAAAFACRKKGRPSRHSQTADQHGSSFDSPAAARSGTRPSGRTGAGNRRRQAGRRPCRTTPLRYVMPASDAIERQPKR